MATIVLSAVGSMIGGPFGAGIGALIGQQIDSVAQQLTAVLPEDVLAQLGGGEDVEAEAALAVEGDEDAESDLPTRSAAPKPRNNCARPMPSARRCRTR